MYCIIQYGLRLSTPQSQQQKGNQMAYEVKAWQQEGCSLAIPTRVLSPQREVYSREINEAFGEGGGLNANYQTVEAVAIATNILGAMGLVYGLDFIFKTAGLDEVSFDFSNLATKERATRRLL